MVTGWHVIEDEVYWAGPFTDLDEVVGFCRIVTKDTRKRPGVLQPQRDGSYRFVGPSKALPHPQKTSRELFVVPTPDVTVINFAYGEPHPEGKFVDFYGVDAPETRSS